MAGADNGVPSRSFLRGRAGQRDLERLVAEQVAVRDGLRLVVRCRDDAFCHGESIDGSAEPPGGERQQRLARFGGRRANLRTAALDCRARDGGALVRRHVRVEPHRGNLAHVEVELLGGNLQQRGARALAELGVSDVGRRGVVGMNGDPRVEEFLIGRARDGDAAGRCVRLLGERHARGFLKAGGAMVIGFGMRGVAFSQQPNRRPAASPSRARPIGNSSTRGSRFMPTTPRRPTSDTPSSARARAPRCCRSPPRSSTST